MYRLLEPNEAILEGDEAWDHFGDCWFKVVPMVGQVKPEPDFHLYRRKIEDAKELGTSHNSASTPFVCGWHSEQPCSDQAVVYQCNANYGCQHKRRT